MVNKALPDGWEWKPLRDVSISQSGAGFPKTYQGETEGTYPFAKVSDISNAVKNNGGSIVSAVNYLSVATAKKIHAKEFPIGTTLFAKIGEAVGLNRRAFASVPVLADNNVMGLIPNIDIVSPKFLYHFMHTVDLYEYSQATTVPSVRKSDVENIPMPLPPLSEQERIVNRIEELLSDLDAGVAGLERTRLGLQRYKASVLKAACEGKLFENEETGSGQLPEGWQWAKLESLLSESLSNGRSTQTTIDGFPVLRLTALKNGKIDLRERKIGAWTKEQAQNFLVKNGDFFVSRGNGSLRLVGRGGLVEQEPDEVAYPDTLIRIRVSPNICDIKYLRTVWDSSLVRNQIETTARTTAGIYKINQKDLGNFIIPLPPLDEQRRIVAEVERRLSVVGEVESAVEVGLVRAGRLRQSVLRSAFEGRL